MYRRPRLAGHPVERVVETHVSWLFFTAGTVYKLKKAVDYGFLDFSTAARRKAACEAEVRLNRRLTAPGVYRGVLDARVEAGTVRILGACPGAACADPDVDHLVEMRRLPQQRCLSRLVPEGRVGEPLVAALAARIAAFHAAAPGGPEVDRFGTPEAVAALVRENLEGLRVFAGRGVPEDLFERARRAQLGFLEAGRPLLASRAASGRVRDGHGDLHLEHVFLLDGETDPAAFSVIDAVEFSPRYRCGDVASDVAFLAMSFALHGRPDLGERFLADWCAESLDYDAYRVVDFYRLYRALVRLKVAGLGGDEDALRRHVALVDALLAPRARPPALIAVGGTVATGKTALAEALADPLGAVVVSSDRVRKTLLGLAPTDSARAAFGAGAYTREAKDLVYRAVTDAGRAVVESGRTALLDATWSRPGHRALVLEAARAADVPVRFVVLSADEAVLRRRLEAREEAVPATASDARLEHLPGMLAAWQPPTEIPPEVRIDLDTGRIGVAAAVDAVLSTLPRPRRPRGAAGSGAQRPFEPPVR